MKIICKKYYWADSTEANKVNFFSNVTPTLFQTLDLTNYLIKGSLSDIEYSFRDIDENNSMILEASNCSFQCINDINGRNMLQNFFVIYKMDQYVRFKLEIYDDANALVYTGVINKDGVKIGNRSESILDITAVGYEIEFKEYFSYEKLISETEIRYSDLPYPMPYTAFRVHKLTDVLSANYEGVQFKFYDDLPYTHFLRWYYVSDKPYILSPAALMYEENYLECKSGYESFVREGTSKFAYLNNLCLSKGWAWYFILNKLYIQELGGLDLNLKTIDFNEVSVSHSVKNETQNFQIDNVIVEAGEYYALNGIPLVPSFPLNIYTQNGWKSVSGSRRYVYSNINPEVMEVRAFRKLIWSVLSSDYYLPNHTSHNTFFLNSQDEYNYSFNKYHTTGSGGNQTYQYNLTTNILDYGVKKSLYINTHPCSRANGGMLDITNARTNTGRYYGNGNSWGDSVPVITDREFGYTGNIGESMIRYDVAIGKYFTYEMDMRSENTHNNFKCFLRNANQVIIDITVNEIITNPYQNIKIINYPYANINDKNFIINKLSFNLNTKTSNLTLQLI